MKQGAVIMLRSWTWTLVITLLLPACRRGGPAASPYRDVLITGVPHVVQKPDLCGEACAEMVLRKLGLPLDQDFVFAQCASDVEMERGCYTAELASGLRKIGFRVGPVWTKVAASRGAADLEGQWRSLHADLVAGVPSIVCGHYDESPGTTEHFRLVLGYSAKTDEVVYHEPAEPRGAYRRMARERFVRLWPLKYERERWTVIRLRLEPGPTLIAAGPTKPAAAPAVAKRALTAADFGRHVAALQRRAPRGFTIVVQPPFVVLGDEPAARVRERAQSTVRWAVERLKQSYFARDPTEIIDIWLLRDQESYARHTWQLFRERPSTPYGYYSTVHRALIMNIATGGGTLVHEIVHPYIRVNFPRCPPWLNEGLGSLYEQSGEEGGKIVGYTNWRLPGLQQALRGKGVPSFRDLTAMTDHQFYMLDRGTNYAQARYLCYYLQQRGLLTRYYRELVAGQAQDPTGYKTLQRVLGERDMGDFQRRWSTFVLKLRFPQD
jgi:hypothetical protein